jgi:hypothetical protein
MNTNAQAMQKYELEDASHVDFFAALKNMQTHEVHDVTDSTCLITGQLLNAFHVKLPCGHQFNYVPLYQEVMRQKGRLGWHSYHEKLNMNQVKCPYCRCITNQLLPYIENNSHPIIKRLTGVNAPATICMTGTPCGHDNCSANAFYEHSEFVYCHKHYQKALKPKPVAKQRAAKQPNAMQPNAKQPNATSRCLAENQSGKNKGKQCKLTASTGSVLCKIHAKCNMVMVDGIMTL